MVSDHSGRNDEGEPEDRSRTGRLMEKHHEYGGVMNVRILMRDRNPRIGGNEARICDNSGRNRHTSRR